MSSGDPFDLERFVAAQDGVYPRALAELRAGSKRSHWMWFVFPQLAGLGSSSMARHYAIRSLGEAQAYWLHPVLGPRLAECGRALLVFEGRTAREIMGFPDDLKLRSSATLFARVATGDDVFERLLAVYFEGRPDLRTLALLEAAPGST